MNLTQREKATLVLDPHTISRPQALNDVATSIDCKDELQSFCIDYRVQTIARNMHKDAISNNEPSPERVKK